jgi:transposase
LAVKKTSNFAKKMRVLKIKQHLSKDELKKRIHLQKTVKDFQDYRILYSVPVNEGKSALDMADYPGVSKNRIYKTVEKYNRLGAGWKDNVRHGGRREARCIMSLEKEKQFLQSIEKEALTGEMITYRQIKSKLEGQINRTVSDDYIWTLLKRHGWKKKVPRPRHPLSDKSTQEEYKKNSLKVWQPNR